MDNFDNVPKVKVRKKTLSLFLNNYVNKEFNSILRHMSTISKNVYNTTIYIYNIFYKYKEEIFKHVYDVILLQQNAPTKTTKTIKNIDDVHSLIYKQLDFFYQLHSKKDSVIKCNNDFLYNKIKEKLHNNPLHNNNYNTIKNDIINENKHNLQYSNKYEYEFIIENILKNIYTNNYNRILYYIINKIPINGKIVVFNDNKNKTKKQPQKTDNPQQYHGLITDVMNKQNLFVKKDSIKTYILAMEEYAELSSDQNIITRFIYTHLGDNKDKLPSDIINNIIPKAFNNMSSFYAIKAKGKYVKMCKYIKTGGLFVLPFFVRSFKLIKDSNFVRLTAGKYVANNYIQITGNNNYICLNQDQDTDYKLYCDKKHLTRKTKSDKLSSKHIVVKCKDVDYYINKNNQNIINSYYVNVEIPVNKINGLIKTIEINPLHKGRYYKLNITYDVGLFSDNFIKKPPKLKPKEKKAKKTKKPKTKSIIKPKTNVLDVTTVLSKKQEKELVNSSVSIDLGITNLVAIYDPSDKQIMIKGNYLTSLNCYYNSLIDIYRSLRYKKTKHLDASSNKYKEKIIDRINKECAMKNIPKEEYIEKQYYDLLIKRKNKIENYLNNVVANIYDMYKSKKHIIIGYNHGWKTKVNMGKKMNRKFYNVPYSKLIYKLKEKFGDKLIITEESYTSKCDALMLEPIQKNDIYTGNRESRGLFISGNGMRLNADINGAINIMRKKIKMRKIHGNVFNPIRKQIRTGICKFSERC